MTAARLPAAIGIRALLLTAVSTAGAVAQERRPFALADVASFRTVEELRASPDGARIAFLVRAADPAGHRYATDLWLAGRDGAERPRAFTSDGRALGPLRWSAHGTHVAFLARRGDETQVHALPASGGEPVALTSGAGPVTTFDWAPDGGRLAVVASAPETDEPARRSMQREDVFVLGRHFRNHRLTIVSLDGAEPRLLTSGSEDVRSVAWSPDGSRIACVVAPTPEADADQEARLRIVDVASGAVTDVPESEQVTALSWSPDSKRLAFSRPFDGHEISRVDVFVWAPGKGRPTNVTSALDRDAEAFFWARRGTSLDVLHSRGTVSAVARVSLGTRSVETLWAPERALEAVDAAGEGWVFVPADAPHDVWRSDRNGTRPQKLTSLNEPASALELPAVETLRWKAPQGDVEGVLTRPAQRDATLRLPLIVKPHGGPRDHSRAAFDPQVAALAAQGFLVLQPNFRGSTGYGDAFIRASIGDWGDGPFADVLAGVDALVERGLADPRRLFLYGWSYGGYLTNWGITHSDRFRAAVSGAGVADFRLQYVLSDARRWRFDYFGGSPFLGHEALYAALSPITHVRRARTPTLFLHGQQDVRCPPAHSLMMHRALSDVGVETELVAYPGEGHSFADPRNVLDRLERILAWFHAHDVGH
jgi:dipeptidyl aminopeptidase/acylaminoacyl peptidase